jgi:hypothetical protein
MLLAVGGPGGGYVIDRLAHTSLVLDLGVFVGSPPRCTLFFSRKVTWAPRSPVRTR